MIEASNTAAASGLLRLPTELHLQIMSHLTTGPTNYRESCELALVNKHFATLVQESLYKNVSLLQPSGSQIENGTRLLLFLRTMTERQDLARHVEAMTVGVRENKIVTEGINDLLASGNRLVMLQGFIERITPLTVERQKWTQALENPSEALLCSLIFAALPSLTAIRLCTVTVLGPPNVSCPIGVGLMKRKPTESPMVDNDRLVQGLRTTGITSLDLPKGLIWAPPASLPMVKTLTFEYDASDVMRAYTLRAFPNVETLVIQLPRPNIWEKREFSDVYDRRIIQPLLASLPKLRTLEVPSHLTSLYTSSDISLRIEKLIIKYAIHDTMFRCILAMGNQPIGATLRFYEVHFSEGEYTKLTEDERAEALVRIREGMEMVVKENGKTVEVLKGTGGKAQITS